MPDDTLKIQIKEEFYYPISHISIERELGLLVAYLVDTNAYSSLLFHLQNLALMKSNDENPFTTIFDEKNLNLAFKDNILGALLFLREHDLFSENTYQSAIEKLSESSRILVEETRMEITAEEKQKSNTIPKVNKNKIFSFFNFAKGNSENKSSDFKKKCSIQ